MDNFIVDNISSEDILQHLKDEYPIISALAWKIGYINLHLVQEAEGNMEIEVSPDEAAFLNTLPLQLAAGIIGEFGQEVSEKIANAILANSDAEVISQAL